MKRYDPVGSPQTLANGEMKECTTGDYVKWSPERRLPEIRSPP